MRGDALNPTGGSPHPIRKYVNTTDTDLYHLAKARNLGIVESIGDIIVVCDSRFKMEADAIRSFVTEILPKVMLYGDKLSGKRSFVENFSACLRKDLIQAGMFNQIIDAYGGMTQELKTRLQKQGWSTRFIKSAKAKEIKSSKNKWSKKDDIYKMKTRLMKLGLHD